MNKTQNYQLNQWEKTDKVLMKDFNADNQRIDAALAKMGNCRMVTGTYVGTGEYHSPYPNTLTFDTIPLVIFVGGTGGYHFWAVQGDDVASPTRGSNGLLWLTLSWTETSVSWFNANSAENQLNSAGKAYRYVALIAKE